LDDKTKEKDLTEEMKKTYGIERGSHGIIIKQISDVATRMEKKLMACKLLYKCHKEEVLAGVVICNTVRKRHHAQLGPIFTESCS
jgi:hypothetical protein